MTVRINKDAINLREKLSQLDKPSGLVGEELLRADTSADAREALNLEEHLFEDFESTGIDDNATSTVVTVSDSGLDVTGTVSSDGLVVTNPATTGTNQEIASFRTASGGGLVIRSSDLSVSNPDTIFEAFGGESLKIRTSSNDRLKVQDNGDVHFYEDTGTTAKFVWDASEERLNLNGSVLGKAPFKTFSYGYTAEYNSYSAGAGFEIMSYQTDGGSPYTKTSDLVANSDGTVPSEMRLLTKANGSSNPTERMRIDSAGNVGIGTASPSRPLDVHGGTIGVTSSTAFSGLQITSANNSFAYVNFGDSDDGNIGQIRYDHSSNAMITKTNNSERMRIDSSGNLLVGTTSTDFNSFTGVRCEASGALRATTSSSTAGMFNRRDSDGSIITLRKDGSTVGSIGTSASSSARISIRSDNGSSGSGLFLAADGVFPTDRQGVVNDATMILGQASNRFKDLYLSGGVITSSDYRLKEDIQPMQSYADTVKQMNLVNFAWKESGTREDGFIAHELQALVPSAVRGDKDAVNEDGEAQYQGVDPLKLIPVLTKALQEALERIETLENK